MAVVHPSPIFRLPSSIFHFRHPEKQHQHQHPSSSSSFVVVIVIYPHHHSSCFAAAAVAAAAAAVVMIIIVIDLHGRQGGETGEKDGDEPFFGKEKSQGSAYGGVSRSRPHDGGSNDKDESGFVIDEDHS